jgi:histidyl-tRNA synthetase
MDSGLIYKKPKGTLDIFDTEYEKISYYKTCIENIFKSNGGVGLETPVFELENLLLNKYGSEAENKLIFKLENYGSNMSEKYALRYDLTVPLQRFLIEHGIKKLRRYSINKVYRRDQPSDKRFREFYQADFDIIGENNTDMVNEFVLLKMANDFLQICGLTDFEILINDTNNLHLMIVDNLGISQTNFKNICQTIDKLDKYEYCDLAKELKEKGLNQEQIEKLKILLDMDRPLCSTSETNYQKLKSYCKSFNFDDKLIFTPSMARGLDYYNGFIFEIKLKSVKSTIISGGRYDNLIPDTSMIGISFGLSRIITVLNYEQNIWKELYYITEIGKTITFEIKLKVMKFLEEKFNIKIILSDCATNRKFIKEINHCIENKIKYMFVIGESEYSNNKIILKNLEKQTQEIIDLI